MENSLVNIRNAHVKIDGLQKKYHFLHITDCHVIFYDENETKARSEYADPRIQAFSLDGITADRRLEALLQHVDDHAAELDGVLFTGDIIDFPSAPNIAYLKDKLTKLSVPYIFVLGNHDWAYFDDYQTPHAIATEKPKFKALCAGNTLLQKYHFGELTFIAMDNTSELYEDGQTEELANAMLGEQNVVVLQHIPLYAETLHSDTVQYWRRDINIGGAGICKNDNYIAVRKEILAPDSPVKALITGHLHYWHEDLLDGKLVQYVTSLGAHGDATLFTFEG